MSYDAPKIWSSIGNFLPIPDEVKEVIPVFDNELIMKRIKEQRELSRVKTRTRTPLKSKSKTLKSKSKSKTKTKTIQQLLNSHKA